VNHEPLDAEAAVKEVPKIIRSLPLASQPKPRLMPSLQLEAPLISLSLPPANNSQATSLVTALSPKPVIPEQKNPPELILTQFNQAVKPTPSGKVSSLSINHRLEGVTSGSGI
jgi:hypothetical protein